MDRQCKYALSFSRPSSCPISCANSLVSLSDPTLRYTVLSESVIEILLKVTIMSELPFFRTYIHGNLSTVSQGLNLILIILLGLPSLFSIQAASTHFTCCFKDFTTSDPFCTHRLAPLYLTGQEARMDWALCLSARQWFPLARSRTVEIGH